MSGSRRVVKLLKVVVLLFPFSLLLTVVPSAWHARGQQSVKSGTQTPSNPVDRKRVAAVLSSLPASFEPNRGQSDPSVKFLSRGPGYALFLTQSEAVLSLPSSAVRARTSPTSQEIVSKQSSSALRLKLLDANRSAEIEGVNPLANRSNYFLGNRSAQRETKVPNFGQVRYRAVYPGIDLIFHGDATRLEFDLDVAPGADVSAVRFRLDGADHVKLDASGDVIASLNASELRLHRPVSYQKTASVDRPVDGKFTLSARNEIGFQMGAYDASLPLVIDPVLAYSTFLGGTGADQVFGVAVDPQGNFYVAGQTASSNLPVTGAFQATSGGFTDAFVAKFNADGSGLVYCTYLGGNLVDTAQGIAVDSTGSTYVTGFTTSTNFPTKNALQSALKGQQDVFVTKLSPDGASLVFSTYLGGSSLDTIAAIALDAQNNVVLAGTTKSTDFPTVNALESSLHGAAGNSDAFVSKISADGSHLIFSTYLGGTSVEGATGVAVDSQGNIVVSGGTDSTDFPALNAILATAGGGPTSNAITSDAFLTKLAGDGSAVLFSTYWGGTGSEQATSVSVDASDNIILVGETTSMDFPTLNPLLGKSPNGGTQITGFVTKFKSDGSSTMFSTYFGGTGSDTIFGSAVDPNGNIYVSGNTTSTDLPVTGAIQAAYGGGASDGFVSELAANGTSLLFSTYLGGAGTDAFNRVAADSHGIYVVGSTGAADFPTTGTQANAFMGSTDGVVVKIATTNASAVLLSADSLTFSAQNVGTVSASQAVTLTNTGNTSLTIASIVGSSDYGETNTCGSGIAAGASCTINVTFKPTASGTRTGTVTITDNASTSPQTVTLTGIGTAVAPVAGVSPGSLTFAAQVVGVSSASQPVSLSNTGTAALTISSVVASGDFSQANNCGNSVAASASCTINVSFKPTASGTRTGTVTITDNASTSPQTVTLTGIGTAVAPVAGVSPGSLTFAAQVVGVSSASQPVSLSNTGTAALTISSVVASGDFSQANNCGNSVAASASCTINVSFKPTASGTRTGTVTITDNASTSPQTVTLTGIGTAVAPVAGVSPGSLTFAAQVVGVSSASQPVSLSNTGTAALTISSVVASGDFSQTNNCGNSVAASASCTINVSFKPTASGTRTGTLTITDNASTSPQTVNLMGSGTASTPVAGVSPGSLTFSSQLAGTPSASQPVTLNNTGTGALTTSSVAASGDFSETNNCGSSVAAGASCTINVVFTPTASGTRTGALTITDNASTSPQKVTLTGNGADFTIMPASGANTSATVARGQTATYSLSIAPTGGLSGTISFACSGAPAASTCSVTPPSTSTDGSSVTNISVSVPTTAATSAALVYVPAPRERGTPAGQWNARVGLWLALIFVALAIPFARRLPLIPARAWRGGACGFPRFANAAGAAVLVAILAVTLVSGGCSGGNRTPVGSAGTPAGTYSLVVTATFTAGTTSVKHNTTLTLTVQ